MMRRYVKERDYDQVALWMHNRNLESPKRDEFPQVGFIQDEVCVGFLVLTDTQTAYLDFFVSNPEADPLERKTALDAVISQLLLLAKDLKYARVVFTSQLETIFQKGRDHEFRFAGVYQHFSKEL